MDKALNILFVEDDLQIQRSMPRVLKTHNLTVVGSGEDAIEAVVANPYFDIIVSDYDIDGYINGGQFFKWVQQKFPNLAKKFMFMSSNDKAKALAEEAGILYLEKPASAAEISRAVHMVAGC